MLTFDQLETLRTIVRCGTFSRAAEEMFLTQPAVSQRVKHLEQALGVEVFMRGSTQRGFHLTEAGERVLGFANEVLGSLDGLQHELQQRSRTERETVTIACGPFIAKYIMPRLIASCRQIYPHLHVRIQQAGMEDLNEVVRHGDADFAVHTEAFIDPALSFLPLFRDRVVLVGHPDHPFLQENPVTPESVAKYQFILSPANTEPRQITERWAANLGVNLDVIMETSSYDALKEGAMQGLGLAVVPETIVHEDVQAGRLCVVRLAGLPCDRLLCLVYNPQRKLSSAAEAIREAVQDGHWREQMLVHNPC